MVDAAAAVFSGDNVPEIEKLLFWLCGQPDNLRQLPGLMDHEAAREDVSFLISSILTILFRPPSPAALRCSSEIFVQLVQEANPRFWQLLQNTLPLDQVIPLLLDPFLELNNEIHHRFFDTGLAQEIRHRLLYSFHSLLQLPVPFPVAGLFDHLTRLCPATESPDLLCLIFFNLAAIVRCHPDEPTVVDQICDFLLNLPDNRLAFSIPLVQALWWQKPFSLVKILGGSEATEMIRHDAREDPNWDHDNFPFTDVTPSCAQDTWLLRLFTRVFACESPIIDRAVGCVRLLIEFATSDRTNYNCKLMIRLLHQMSPIPHILTLRYPNCALQRAFGRLCGHLMQTDVTKCDFVAQFWETGVITTLVELGKSHDHKTARNAMWALVSNIAQFPSELISAILQLGFLKLFDNYYLDQFAKSDLDASHPSECLMALISIVGFVGKAGDEVIEALGGQIRELWSTAKIVIEDQDDDYDDEEFGELTTTLRDLGLLPKED
jgi:hypothetical protein